MLRAGADVGDPLLQALLLDDVLALKAQIAEAPSALARRLTPVNTIYLPPERDSTAHLRGVQLDRMWKAAYDAGADVNALSLVDADGSGGPTPGVSSG
jgi:hypothetical protein